MAWCCVACVYHFCVFGMLMCLCVLFVVYGVMLYGLLFKDVLCWCVLICVCVLFMFIV